MTPQRAKELLPVIQAFAEGKEIEVKGEDEDVRRWRHCGVPIWADCLVYRIKPEPREWWLWWHDSVQRWVVCLTKPQNPEAIHVREVLE